MIQAGDTIPNGWFWDGEQQVFHDGTGNFYIGQQWYARPDLLTSQPFPAPPTKGDRARMEMQRLTTPWPSYGEAWREAKALKSWWRRYAIFGIFMILPVLSALATYADEHGGTGDQASFPLFMPEAWLIFGLLLTVPFAWWKVYHCALKRRDTHKAAAFAIASYGVVAVGAHAAANDGHLFRQSHQQVITEVRRFTG